jgi:ferredoxin-type protein NapG
VQGKMGSHYRLGWLSDTPITQEFKPPEPAPVAGPAASEPPAPVTAPGMDVLNQGIDP